MNFKETIIDILSKSKFKHPNIYTNQGNGLENIDKSLLFEIRNIHELSKDVDVLHAYISREYKSGSFFEAERIYYESVLILDESISIRKIEQTDGWAKADDFKIDVQWDEIDDTEVVSQSLKDDNGKNISVYYIRIYSKEDSIFLDIPLYNFGRLSTEDDATKISNLINIIVEAYQTSLDVYENKNQQTFKLIEDRINSLKYSEALEIINNNYIWDNIKSDPEVLMHLSIQKAKSLNGISSYSDAANVINEAISQLDNFENIAHWKPLLFQLRGDINQYLKNYANAVQDFHIAFQNSSELSHKQNYQKSLSNAYTNLKNNFFDISFSQRKTILLYDEIKPTEFNEFIVLDRSNLPANITFPIGHPKTNEIYVAHPYLQKSYIPYNIYENSVFNSQYEEFCYFLQCLGAKSLTIKVLKGKELSTSNDNLKQAEASVEFGKKVIKNNIEASIDNKISKSNNEISITSRTRIQTYSPIKKPYIPKNLIWYHNEPSWQRLYEQRINGNILQHHDILSSQNSHSITKTEQTKLKLAFKNFFINAKVDLHELIEDTFNNIESVEWEIFVEFESVENLTQIHSDNLHSEMASINNAEQEYLEEVKFMLEDDGIIDDKERAILERLRIRKGIEKDRANELESSILFISHLNDKEKEYLEEFRELLNYGEITEKERRILDRIANRTQLSQQRVVELEKLILCN